MQMTPPLPGFCGSHGWRGAGSRNFLPPLPPKLQNKERVRMELIKPAVNWREAGVADATNRAAIAINN